MLPSANLVGQSAEDLCLDVVPVLVEGEGAGASVVGQPLLRAPHLQDVAQVGSQNLEPDIFQMFSYFLFSKISKIAQQCFQKEKVFSISTSDKVSEPECGHFSGDQYESPRVLLSCKN